MMTLTNPFSGLESYEEFRNVVVNMAVNSPEMCAALIKSIQREQQWYSLYDAIDDDLHSGNLFQRYAEELLQPTGVRISAPLYFSMCRGTGRKRGGIGPKPDDWLELFIMVCAKDRVERTAEGEELIDSVLQRLYGRDAARGMKFLLERTSGETLREFAYTYLSPDALAKDAGVKVIVKETPKEQKRTGNIGKFLICTQKDEPEEQMLKFTNQSSAVYYLMFLIDRCHKQDMIPPTSLQKNEKSFLELYRKIYDVSEWEARKKYDSLLYRKEGDRIRVGRQNEAIYDIRKHLAERFEQYDESYFPYAMTADSHLSVSSDRIVFAEHAQDLLNLNFV